MGTSRRLPRAIHAIHALRRPPRRPLARDGAPGARGNAVGGSVRGVPRRGVHHVRAHVRTDGDLLQGALPPAGIRQRLRLPPNDHGEDLRHAPRAAARRHAVEPGDLRHRPELRAAADASGGAPSAGDARLRRADDHGAPQGDPGVPQTCRRGGPRPRVGTLLGGQSRARRGAHDTAARRHEGRGARGGHAHGLGPRGRAQGGGRGALRRLGPPRRSTARGRARHDPGPARGDLARERGRARESPTQAGSRLGAHALPLRRPLRLRRLPRPATAPPAHDRMAAAHHRTRLRDPVPDRRGRPARRTGTV